MGTPNVVPHSTTQSNRKKRWVIVIATVVFTAVLLFFIRLQGYVSGVEFAPTHFQRREFSFFEIPLLHVQITPIERSAQTSNTGNYLRANSLVKTQRGTPDTWHLVSIRRGLTGTTPADAHFLTDQLDFQNQTDFYWRIWSIDHPQHAKILWPMIQDLAVRELYLLMPPLFELAQIEQTPEELKANLKTRLESDLVSLIEDVRADDDDQLADLILEEAIQMDPTLENLLRMRVSKPSEPKK